MTKLEKFQKRLTEVADAALITSLQNQFYLSRFPFSDGYLLIFSDAAYLLTDFRYEEAAREKAERGFTVLSPQTGAFSQIAALLKRHGAATLLLEESAVTLSEEKRLADSLDSVELRVGASEILKDMRQYKDEKDCSAIRVAQELTNAAFLHILKYITPNRTESEVALELELFMRRNGSEGIAFDTIAVSGSASAIPHGTPRNIPLEQGFLTMDFGARFAGYCADMTRTVVIGRADEEMKRLYHTVLQAQEAALATAAAGVPCRQMDAVARDIIHGAGYVGCFGHSLGHGVGIDVHEAPSLSARAPENAVLTPGQVVTIEPGIYVTGKYGCRIEDMIVITKEGGMHNFTKAPKELIELCI